MGDLAWSPQGKSVFVLRSPVPEPTAGVNREYSQYVQCTTRAHRCFEIHGRRCPKTRAHRQVLVASFVVDFVQRALIHGCLCPKPEPTARSLLHSWLLDFVQVIVISHELSDPNDYDDHLAQVLAPAVPLLLLGRSRDAGPACKAQNAVWHAWKDRFGSSSKLPKMLAI